MWWGELSLAEGELRRWRIGPARIWIGRRPQEWRVATSSADDDDEGAIEVGVPAEEDEIPEGVKPSRFSFARPAATVSLLPMPADRAVVVRPEAPFFVPAGETVTLFVSTPLWVQIKVGDGRVTLLDAPVVRPSDTWFGTSTREGELAYASRTTARLSLGEGLGRPHRATTPLRIRNRAGDALLLDRVRVPVRFLTLYRDARGLLWTQRVTLTREADGDIAALHVGSRAAREAGEVREVAGPRDQIDRNLAVRAFSRLFGGQEEED